MPNKKEITSSGNTNSVSNTANFNFKQLYPAGTLVVSVQKATFRGRYSKWIL
jgi:hypothetical protein